MTHDNRRRPSGLAVNGVPSADQIIELGRTDAHVAAALGYWKRGDLTFDEALRLAVYHLAQSNHALIEHAVQLQMTQTPTLILDRRPPA